MSRSGAALRRSGAALAPCGFFHVFLVVVFRLASFLPRPVPSTERPSYPSAFRALAQLLDVGVLILTSERTVDFANERAQALLQCPSSNRDTACWHRVRAAIDPLLDQAGRGTDPVVRGTVFLDEAPAGQQIVLDVYRLHDPADQHVGYVSIVKDQDAALRVEHSLRLAMQMRHTGQLYEAAAHDLRQPIGAILIHLKVLEEMGPSALTREALDAPFREAIQTIRAEVNELDSSLQLLLRELSPNDTEERISLNEVTRGIARLIRPQVEKAGLQLEPHITAEPLVIQGWRSRIKQAILNLATNAIEAMPGRGTLTMRLNATAGKACIEVSDEGPGIAPEVQARMYDRHFTTKPGGTGLGLHLVKETAEAHGGRVTAKSTPGQGTTFSLYLPLVQNTARSAVGRRNRATPRL